jgi:hypothetical protein
MLAPSRQIIVRPDEGGFTVEVLPPSTEGANSDQFHATLKAARGYARGLRMCLGLKVLDLCGEANG